MDENDGFQKLPTPKEDVPHYYVDQVRALDTAWDVTMMMGQIRPIGIGENDGAKLVPVFSVTMSHVHAKRFAEVVTGLMEAHEEKFGPIQGHEPRTEKGDES